MKENGKKSKVVGIILGGIGAVVAGVYAILRCTDGEVTPEVCLYGSPVVAKRTFNSNFTPYEGENQSASQVRALRSAVEASNASDEHKVKLDMSGVTLTSSGKYKITITYYADGYVNEIIVEEEENSSLKNTNDTKDDKRNIVVFEDDD